MSGATEVRVEPGAAEKNRQVLAYALDRLAPLAHSPQKHRSISATLIFESEADASSFERWFLTDPRIVAATRIGIAMSALSGDEQRLLLTRRGACVTMTYADLEDAPGGRE